MGPVYLNPPLGGGSNGGRGDGGSDSECSQHYYNVAPQGRNKKKKKRRVCIKGAGLKLLLSFSPVTSPNMNTE